MAKNLNRLTAAASRQAAHRDFMYVYRQVKKHNPPYEIYDFMFADDWQHTSAKKIDQATRALITWAQNRLIEIKLPEGWN